MAKGKIVQLTFRHQHDEKTGHEVIRLTPPHIICHRNYFYQKCFTRDGGKLLFGGAFEGHWNYYLLDLARHEATQLTEGAGDNTFGGFLSADDRSLWYVKNTRELRRVDLHTLEEHIVYQVDDDWVAYGTWVANSACTKLVGIEIKKSDWQPLTDWQKFRDFYFTQPECRLIRIDLHSGERDTLLQEKRWLGHPIYRPFDDSTVAFCHEGPRDVIDARMWLINEDGSNLRKVRQHQPGESFTHEFWVPDGSALYYVAHQENDPRRYLFSADPQTLENRQLMAIPPCSHLMSNEDGSLVVGDGAPHHTGAIHLNDPFIWVFNINSGEQTAICQHNSSWKVLDGDRQVTHPHPSFTPDNQWVLYTSDAEGMPALYLARV
ncbi:oligogalacturonate lyase family protein [Kosakonia radicincitans]|uniref:oligogalacturonate lyase family protein n=1 Tax=Kosakonia radicincitans TaxID=283686 RepID=UPI0008ACD812|nr:oligogalacturonate lyase family protein [Kosakonia radicincitans]SET32444.1 oligogalacturonide lyase [Kosakonia radicincitans]VVT45765.1 Oligogalacturonate lyase (EC [Kosakonia radicincitans]